MLGALQSLFLLSAAHAVVGQTAYAPKTPPLDTPWTANASTNPWPEYPRPQLKRDQWANLNGIWQFQAANASGDVNSPPTGQTLSNEILVPSCQESGISGIQASNIYSWYRTEFEVPSSFSQSNVLLNFGAIDYEATVFVNGQKVDFHRGGYQRFQIDVTPYLSWDAKNELIVFVYDPTDTAETIPTGKQMTSPSHIFYTPCTGIWQSVFIESAPAAYVTRLDVFAGMDGTVNATVHANGNATDAIAHIDILDADGTTIASGEGAAGSVITFNAGNVSLWSPDSPTLYDVAVTYGDDVVSSYTGFRTIEVGSVNDIPRPLLNGKFVFQFGPLDQGFWPDGIHTPPSYDAMVYDLQVLKDLGINMLRKHIKVENDLYYSAADKLGILIWQDSVCLTPGKPVDDAAWDEFVAQAKESVSNHLSHPSIVLWTVINEGWGQPGSREVEVVDQFRAIDPTRLINAASGWNDHGAGDIHDNHHYSNPQCGTPFSSIPSTPYDGIRIGVQGEFGGIGHNVSIDHLWNVPQAINSINETYAVATSLEAWNYLSLTIIEELRDQIEKFSCSAAVWTQTTDVEGEVNGFLTYDREILRTNDTWKTAIAGLYETAASRT